MSRPRNPPILIPSISIQNAENNSTAAANSVREKNFKSCSEDVPAVKDTSSEFKPYGFAHKCLVNHWALLKSRRTNSFHPLAGSLNPSLGNNSAAV